jgi:hypothetical protein
MMLRCSWQAGVTFTQFGAAGMAQVRIVPVDDGQ